MSANSGPRSMSANRLNAILAGVGEAVVNNAMVTLETTANGFNAFKTFWDEASMGLRGYRTFFFGPEWEYSPEYLAEKKKNLGRLFPQEYPMTALEAFLNSGNPYFDAESMKFYLENAIDPKKESLIYV